MSLIDNKSKKYSPLYGINGGLETIIHFKEQNIDGIFNLNFSTYNIPEGLLSYYSQEYDNKIENFQLTFGSRFYLKKNFFVQGELGISFYNRRTIYKTDNIYPEWYYFIMEDYNDIEDGFAMNFGAGKLFPFSNTVSLLTLAKIHFSSPEKRGVLYFTFNAGLQFKNRNKEEFNKPKMSASIYGGIANAEGFHSVVYKIIPNFGIEGTYCIGLTELFLNVLYNPLKYKYEVNSRAKSVSSILLGSRLFVGENTRAFFEFGGGFYIYENNTSRKTTADNIGIIAGTGICQKLYSHLSGIIKTDLNWIFNEHLRENSFLALDAGLRWDF